MDDPGFFSNKKRQNRCHCLMSQRMVKNLSSASVRDVKNHKPSQKSIMHSDLNFNSQIKSAMKSDEYHLKNISRIKGLMCRSDLEKLLRAFISSRPDQSL